jgi:vacuolar-type H+-ATPase subunit H
MKSLKAIPIMMFIILLVSIMLLFMAVPSYASAWPGIRDLIAPWGLQWIAPWLIGVFGLIATWLIVLACNVLAKLANKIGNETLRASFISAITEAENVAKNAVATVKQTYTDAIKAASADGKLTKAEQAAALAKARDVFISSISDEALTILKETFSDYMAYITNLIEAKLGLLKNSKASS